MITELYKLKRGTKFKLVEDTRMPPDLGGLRAGTVLTLGNIDGMYSYCWDANKTIYHPIAWAKVEEVTTE